MFERLRELAGGGTRETVGCGCEAAVEGTTLVVDGDACEAGAALASKSACRSTAVDAVDDRSVTAVSVTASGRVRDYRGDGAALLAAAGRFATIVAGSDPRLARRARRDPLGAAREAAHRADEAATVARDAGLTRFTTDADGYQSLLEPTVGPTVSDWRVDPSPPPDSRLVTHRRLDTDATVRIYERAGRSTRVYHLEPAEARFDPAADRALADAYQRLATTPLTGAESAPVEAVRAVAGADVRTAAVARALRKHCHECGLLRDFFADPALSDAFVTAPAERNAVRVRVDGETMATNVTVTDEGVATLASRFRRESGRGFSRAQPTLDAATTVGDRRVRVAGVTEPVTDGQAFAFRAHDRDVWTLPALVANDTFSAEAAGLLSVCVERGGAVLLAGPRGSGKTTALGALLWEIPDDVRTVVIEDTPELPVRSLQLAERDVQGLRTDDGVLDPAAALRTALRLGDGALAIGEVRGPEAQVLYEAMRVGANSEAVLGTIHGDGGGDVFERVVSDLGVPASSFGVTDLVVTLETATGEDGPTRRVRAVEEVRDGEPGSFVPLFDRTGSGLAATGRLARGNSRLAATLARPDESYADVLDVIEQRAGAIEKRSATGVAGETRPTRTGPGGDRWP